MVAGFRDDDNEMRYDGAKMRVLAASSRASWNSMEERKDLKMRRDKGRGKGQNGSVEKPLVLRESLGDEAAPSDDQFLQPDGVKD